MAAAMQPPIAVHALPEGVWLDEESNTLMHHHREFAGFFDADGNRLPTPETVAEQRRLGKKVYEDHKNIPLPCRVPSSPPWDVEGIERERKQAVLDAVCFHHPQHGHLVWGRKREREATENRGTGAIQRHRVRRESPADPDIDPVAAAPVADAKKGA